MLIRSQRLVVTGEEFTEPMTTAIAKSHCRIDSSDEDTYLVDIITRARQESEGLCGRRFGSQSWRLTFDAFHSVKLIGCGSILEITKVQYRIADGAWVDISPSQYELISTAPAKINFFSSFSNPAAVEFSEKLRVDLKCGDPLDGGARSWNLLRIASLFENRDTPPEPSEFMTHLLDAQRITLF
jgi:uncharacterized phiE125 gp8 family phage protein